nr:polymorphic toxin type 15 domain-containing protein [uncultured Moellerella sp.]
MQQNSGNTLGVIQNQSPKSKASAANANPVVKAESANEAEFLAAALKGDSLRQGGLELTPVIGVLADGVNTGTSAARGDYINDPLAPAALSSLTEWRAQSLEQDSAASQKENNKALNIEQQSVINRPSSGAKIKPIRLPSQKLKCFFSYKNKKFKKMSSQDQQKYLAEYNKQLKRQQDAINNMSAEEFLTARKAYQIEGRNKLSQQMQADYRMEKRRIIEKSIYRSLKNNGFSASYAKKRAAERTEEIMKNMAVLHEPDMAAGGWNNPKPQGVGSGSINSSIGSLWSKEIKITEKSASELLKESRIISMDKSAQQAVNNKLNSAKMNIELEVCRGKGQ